MAVAFGRQPEKVRGVPDGSADVSFEVGMEVALVADDALHRVAHLCLSVVQQVVRDDADQIASGLYV